MVSAQWSVVASMVFWTAFASSGAAPPVEVVQEVEPPTTRTIERLMVLTFDDLPAQRAQGLPEARIHQIMAGLTDLMVAEKIPAIGFVNENKLEVDGVVDPQRLDRLIGWLDAGLELGNHAYAHLDLHRVPVAEFEQDIVLGERITRPLAARHGSPYRYFRHPFLHTGRDAATKQRVEAFLADRGYRVAPVTIDNSEWIFARAYDEALDRQDPDLAQKLGEAYVEYMVAMTAYYEGQSRSLFGREIPQIVLLHANAINADHLASLIARWRERGYWFTGLDTALADPAFSSADRYFGRGGITWLHRWAITRKVDPEMFRGEPRTPTWVQEVAGIRE